MRAFAERLMCRPIGAGHAADGATSTAVGFVPQPWGADGGAAFGPAIRRAS